MNAKELRLAAERIAIRCARPGDVDILAQHILATVRQDDEDPVTVDDCEKLGLPNSSRSPYQRRYELAPGIRIIAQACPGGFNLCELWIGGGNDFRQFKSIRKGQLRHLLAGLGMENNTKGKP